MLAEILQLCPVHEQITTQAQLFNATSNEQCAGSSGMSTNVNRIAQNSWQDCNQCEKRNHKSSDPSCPARNGKCYKHGAARHFSVKYRAKSSKPNTMRTGYGQHSKRKRTNSRVNFLGVQDQRVDEEQQTSGKQNLDCFLLKARTAQCGLKNPDQYFPIKNGGF